MKTATLLRALVALDACAEARAWVAAQPDTATAWVTCSRTDWLIWLLAELHAHGLLSRQTLVLAVCAVAETALRYVPAGEDRPRLAIETARRWARGEATIDEVRAARAAADKARAYAALSVCYRPHYLAYRAAGSAYYAAAAAEADPSVAACYAYFAAIAAAVDAYGGARAAAAAVPWSVVEAALAQVET